MLVKNDKIRKPEILKISDHNILPESLDKDASSIVHRLNEAGFEAYIVGGFVRDSILGLKPKDSDVVTNNYCYFNKWKLCDAPYNLGDGYTLNI